MFLHLNLPWYLAVWIHLTLTKSLDCLCTCIVSEKLFIWHQYGPNKSKDWFWIFWCFGSIALLSCFTISTECLHCLHFDTNNSFTWFLFHLSFFLLIQLNSFLLLWLRLPAHGNDGLINLWPRDPFFWHSVLKACSVSLKFMKLRMSALWNLLPQTTHQLNSC